MIVNRILLRSKSTFSVEIQMTESMHQDVIEWAVPHFCRAVFGVF